MPKDKRRTKKEIEPAKSFVMADQKLTISELHTKIAGLTKGNSDQLQRLLAYGRKLSRLKGLMVSKLSAEQKIGEVEELLRDWQ